MSRLKLTLLTVVAAMALSAIASSSALAETKPCKETGSNRWVFCFDSGLEIGTPPQLALGVSHLSLLTGTVGIVEVKIHCPKDDIHLFLELLGKTKGLILFLQCTVVKPATGCLLHPSDIHVKFTDLLVGHPLTPEDEFTGEGTNETFATLNIEHESGKTCAVEGNFSVTGKQKCGLPEFGTPLVVHDIDCKKSGSNLKLGENAASFSSLALVHLGAPNLGLKWYVDLGL
jgi:hypothetical protein